MPQPESTVRHALQWLYDDASLRSNLSPATHHHLRSWAEQHVRRAAAGNEASFGEGVNRTREAMAVVNELAAARTGLSAAALRRRLDALPVNRSLTLPALRSEREELASRGAAMSETEFLIRLLKLVDPLAPGSHPRALLPSGRATVAEKPAPSARRGGALALGALLVGLTLCVALLVGAYAQRGRLAGLFPSAAPPATFPPVTVRPTVAPTSDWYEIYFTTPGRPSASGPDVALARLLDGATRSIDVAIYELDREIVVEALLAAHARGVRVRVVTDIDLLLDDAERDAYARLDEAGVGLVGGNSNGIMHNKFAVIDGATLWTGSWNFSDNDTERHDNHAIAIRSPELAANYAATFEKMWEAQQFGPNRAPGGVTHRLTIGGIAVENYFSPEDGVTARIVARIAAAQRSVHFLAFSFTSDPIGDAILERAASGVAVRGVFETLASETEYSELPRFRQSGLDVRQDGNPYFLHHKVFIIDERTVILGSFNFSNNAETINDENILIIDDPVLAARFLAEFERIYAQAKP